MTAATSTLWIVFSAAVALLIAYAMGLFSSRNHMPVDGKTVLLTGASEGMGLAAARLLSAKGASVIIVSRSVSKMQHALDTIRAAALRPDRQRFHSIAADVGAADYADAIVAEAIEWNGGRSPELVWCVAGVSIPGLFAESPMWATRRAMDVNFYGMAEMARAILRVWQAQDAPVEPAPRHLIFTTSIAAFFSVAGYTTYSPSKWAVRALADGLSQEVLLYPQKVSVHLVAPGTMLTAGFERENETKPEVTQILEKDDPRFTAEDMAGRAVAALERGEYMITSGFVPGLMKYGMLGGSLRNSWLVDTVMAVLTPLVWLFVLPDILRTIRKFARDHGHPGTYAKQPKRE